MLVLGPLKTKFKKIVSKIAIQGPQRPNRRILHHGSMAQDKGDFRNYRLL